MIRILHVITRLDVGGPPEVLLLAMSRLPREEFACELISGPTLNPPPRVEEDVSRGGVRWRVARNLRRSVNPLADCLALRELTQAIKRIQPDILHTHTSKAGFLGRLAGRLAGARHVVHTPHGHVFGGYFSPLTTSVFAMLERSAARWTDRITTLTAAEARQYLALRIGRPEQFVTIPAGVDLAPVLSAPPIRLVEDGPVIGTVARLVPVKGLHYMINAAPDILRRFPDARFVLVGDGELRQALKAKARALSLDDRVVFSGFREDVPSLIAGMDLFVLPSLNEGLGLVLVMAMALGKPIVATAVGGVPEVLGEGEAGMLVPPRDSRALADAICTLLGNPARAQALGQAGRRRAPLYSAEGMVAALAKLYREVTDGARRH